MALRLKVKFPGGSLMQARVARKRSLPYVGEEISIKEPSTGGKSWRKVTVKTIEDFGDEYLFTVE
jgi:hypothetical protein